MKRAVFTTQTILMFFLALLAGSYFIGGALDYEVILCMPRTYVWMTACSALAAGITARRADIEALRASLYILPLVLPAALLYNLALIWLRLAEYEQILVPAVLILVCSMYLFHKCARRTKFRMLCKILSPLLLALFLLLLPFAFFEFGKTTVVQTLDSPDGRYRAQLIDIDEGALGGATDVRVTDRRKSLHLGLIRFDKNVLVYRTGWGAFEDMQLYWENEETLRIDGQSYAISEMQ